MTSRPSEIKLDVEVPGTVHEVWAAVATGPGISSWYVPHEVEERTGGVAVARFGPGDDMKVPGRVAVWKPPHRIRFDGGESSTDGLTFDWTVEPTSNERRCVVRLVNGGFGQGGPWDETYDAMTVGWQMFLANLVLHLEHFAGRQATAALPTAAWTGPRTEVWSRLLSELGVAGSLDVGDRVEVRIDDGPELIGSVAGVAATRLSLVLDGPSPGTALVAAEGDGDEVQVSIWTYRYGEEAASTAEADQAGWQEWLSVRASS